MEGFEHQRWNLGIFLIVDMDSLIISKQKSREMRELGHLVQSGVDCKGRAVSGRNSYMVTATVLAGDTAIQDTLEEKEYVGIR